MPSPDPRPLPLFDAAIGVVLKPLSVAKVSNFLPAAKAELLFMLAGIAFFAGFVYLTFFRLKDIPFIVKAYLFFYTVLMMNWPFYDPRFWVPVLPLVAVVLVQYLASVKRIWMVAVGIYFLLGAAAVGYQTYTSLNREVFARTQANGVYRSEYETFFYGRPREGTERPADPNIVNILRRYDR